MLFPACLGGNLKHLDGGGRIEDAGKGRVVLRWNNLIEPDGFLPPLIGAAVIRSNIEDQSLGAVREIEGCEALSRANERKGKS